MTISKNPAQPHHPQRDRGAGAQAQVHANTHTLVRHAQRRALPLLAACLMAGCAVTSPGNAPPSGNAPLSGNAQPGAVSVTFAEPLQFGDTRNAPRETDKARRAWLDALALHLAERAAQRLPEGQRLGACWAWSVDREKRPQREHFLPNLQPHSMAMGQKDGEKWTAGANLQSTIPKSDRLLGFDINGDCVMPKKD